MPSYNKVMLMGHLTRTPELRYTGGGGAVASFGMAVNRKWKGKDGQDGEETLFVDCTAWGRTAEVMAEHLEKGRAVFVEGRLKLDQWDDKATGAKRSKITVTVERFEFLGGKGDGYGIGDSAEARTAQGDAQPGRAQQGDAYEPPQDDEIPF